MDWPAGSSCSGFLLIGGRLRLLAQPIQHDQRGADRDGTVRQVEGRENVALSYIARYCTALDAVSKMPKLTFYFDDSLEKGEETRRDTYGK